MTTPAPSPAPAKRSKRMVVWMVAVPIVILLLALAGANWKRFHLAYAKHLIASDDLTKQKRGVTMVLRTHLRDGMSLEEVRRLLAPAKASHVSGSPQGYPFTVAITEEGKRKHITLLSFDKDGRLRRIVLWGQRGEITDILPPGK